MVGNGENNKLTHQRPADPAFGDIVGQKRLKEALLAVVTDDALDGLLIRGEKGTAKSSAVRALVELLPTQRAVADCPYGCPPDDSDRQCTECRDRTDLPTTERPVPLVTLPLGATRERVVGSLSVADALAGEYEFDPGLLARANRGILYVDEVNLLDDHLVDVLLDAAASGHNSVERDGISVSHPASFTLVGTMNPEEGDLRPQLRDRFALQTTVSGCTDIDKRVTIVEQALGRGTDSDEGRNSGFREQLAWAREHVAEVSIGTGLVEDIAELCRDAGVDGHRGDIATARAARTLAALDGRTTVEGDDVRRAAELALPHRLQSRPFEDTPESEEVIDEHFEQQPDESDSDDETTADDGDSGGDGDTGSEGAGDDSRDDEEHDGGEPATQGGERPPDSEGSGTGPDDEGADAGSASAATTADGSEGGEGSSDGTAADERATPLVPGQQRAPVGDGATPSVGEPDATGHDGEGSRASVQERRDGTGPRVRMEPTDDPGRVDAMASVQAASRRGAERVAPRDLRQSVRASETSALVVFAIDASASMRPAMRTAKGTVLELLKDAYQQRDEVAVVTFAGDDAEVVLPPTDSVSLAARHLKDLPTGDRTPLPAGLMTTREVIERADPAASVVVLVTDGRANTADQPVATTRDAAGALADTGAHVVVVDADTTDRTGLTGLVAEETDGEHIALSALSAGHIDDAAGATRPDTR